jgi:hypothetical protein
VFDCLRAVVGRGGAGRGWAGLVHMHKVDGCGDWELFFRFEVEQSALERGKQGGGEERRHMVYKGSGDETASTSSDVLIESPKILSPAME